jgi:hypothetical protein
MIRFRKGLLDHGGEPTLTHRASPAQAAAPSPQGPASAVLTGASSGAAASAGALGMEQSCVKKGNYSNFFGAPKIQNDVKAIISP